mmetsp:Transcript_30136/g.83147  ORF Transcript_30136/g.83147 Transcript_30136/m.83147 type:complete len:259 (+) Transcript_30136:506-1282(+)
MPPTCGPFRPRTCAQTPSGSNGWTHRAPCGPSAQHLPRQRPPAAGPPRAVAGSAGAQTPRSLLAAAAALTWTSLWAPARPAAPTSCSAHGPRTGGGSGAATWRRRPHGRCASARGCRRRSRSPPGSRKSQTTPLSRHRRPTHLRAVSVPGTHQRVPPRTARSNPSRSRCIWRTCRALAHGAPGSRRAGRRRSERDSCRRAPARARRTGQAVYPPLGAAKACPRRPLLACCSRRHRTCRMGRCRRTPPGPSAVWVGQAW